MKSISVFGATGSIGCTSANILKSQPDDFRIEVVTGGSNVEQLAKTAISLNARHAVIADQSSYRELKKLLVGHAITSSAGRAALLEAASIPVDVSLQGIVGFAGVECSLIAAKSSKVLALANKESLVCAGPLLKQVCNAHGTTLVPVDSEHSAIFQCLQGEKMETVERIILTASGGPFLNYSQEQLQSVTAQQAAAHPRWSMGQRISIDSASMFNKAMELIETKELFNVSIDSLEVIIQPQSIIHSMVGFCDGAIMAHLGPPDMTGAIGYALNHPDRVELPLQRLDFGALGRLDFISVDHDKFPAIRLASDAMRISGLAGAAFNAAKEQALDMFLVGDIDFMDMSKVVEKSLDNFAGKNTPDHFSFADIVAIDRATRKYTQETIKGI
jgi:1-deoxy-D-xylulose-5-phosphate reductoisomerase